MTATIFDRSNRTVFNQAGSKDDGTYELHYFGLLGRAATIRMILEVTGAKYKSIPPSNWPAEKPLTAFGSLPILRETGLNGKTIEVAESEAIERYLGEKYHLMGDDVYERTVVNTFLCSNASFLNQLFLCFGTVSNPEDKAKGRDQLVSKTIPNWAKTHEKHLQTMNGAQGGHLYLGTKLTVADLKCALIVSIIQTLTGSDFISEDKTPALWGLKAEVDKDSNLSAWRQTEEYKKMAETNRSMLGF
ncbi:hypothetical protein BGZ70_007761 [Mortierella alpina]|uniref:Glutathione S-transferase n=1 Tax=Mortierella alpina TaxID=64518 RepID=A0A9P6JDV4_MORAP|nr:hypothetical protein BGZ70_007761 [Mortierella alpina]